MKSNAVVLASLFALVAPSTAFAIPIPIDASVDAGADAGDADAAPNDASTVDGGDDTADAATENDAAPGDDDASVAICSIDPLCVGKAALDKCGADDLGVCVASTCADGETSVTCGDFVQPSEDAGVAATNPPDAGADADDSSDDSGCNVGAGSTSSVFVLLGLVLPFVTRRRRFRA